MTSRTTKIEALRDALEVITHTLPIPEVMANPEVYRGMVDAANYLFSQYAAEVLEAR